MKKTIASLSLICCLCACTFTYPLSNHCRVVSQVSYSTSASLCLECYLMDSLQSKKLSDFVHNLGKKTKPIK